MVFLGGPGRGAESRVLRVEGCGAYVSLEIPYNIYICIITIYIYAYVPVKAFPPCKRILHYWGNLPKSYKPYLTLTLYNPV